MSTIPTVAPLGLSHVSLKVRDLAASVVWYGRVLGYATVREGLAPTPDRTPHAIGLIGAAAVELLEAPDALGSDPERLGVVGLSLTVEDADAALAALQGAGVAVLTPVIAAECWRVLFLHDPDGNLVELVQQPEGAPDMGAWAEAEGRR